MSLFLPQNSAVRILLNKNNPHESKNGSIKRYPLPYSSRKGGRWGGRGEGGGGGRTWDAAPVTAPCLSLWRVCTKSQCSHRKTVLSTHNITHHFMIWKVDTKQCTKLETKTFPTWIWNTQQNTNDNHLCAEFFSFCSSGYIFHNKRHFC